MPMTVDDLAQEIRRVDGNHSIGAGAFAERYAAAETKRADALAEQVKVRDAAAKIALSAALKGDDDA